MTANLKIQFSFYAVMFRPIHVWPFLRDGGSGIASPVSYFNLLIWSVLLS